MKCSDCGFWKSEECTTNLDWVDFNYAENFACFAHKDDVVEINPEEIGGEVITDRYGTPVPMGFNWGAFFLPALWMRRHKILPSIRDCIRDWRTYFIYFPEEASRLAWENCEWDSAEHFIRTQRKWARWGLAVAAFWIALILASFITIKVLANNSP
jgi:hypothetical protein